MIRRPLKSLQMFLYAAALLSGCARGSIDVPERDGGPTTGGLGGGGTSDVSTGGGSGSAGANGSSGFMDGGDSGQSTGTAATATAGTSASSSGGNTASGNTGMTSSGTSSSLECTAPEMACTVFNCIDTSSSDEHCGGCDMACAAGTHCTGGDCVCDGPTQMDCGSDSCVDTATSDDHCGGCDQACTTGTHCTGGDCVCDGDYVLCGGTCESRRDVDTDCSECASTCGVGMECSAGACVCAGNQLECGGSCVDTLTDSAHCGSCDRACPAAHSCAEGACKPNDAGAASCTPMHHDGHDYLLCPLTIKTWQSARSDCTGWGDWDLVVIDDSAEQTAVAAAAGALPLPTSWWLGGSDGSPPCYYDGVFPACSCGARTAGTDEEGAWRWVDPGAGTEGTLFCEGGGACAAVGGAFANWAAGAPDNSMTGECPSYCSVNDCDNLLQFNTDQDCLQMGVDGKWDDVDCEQTLGFICEAQF